MKLLLHTCCAPCSVYCIDSLREEKIEPTVYWFNPNIHPYMEYKSRRDTLKQYTEMINIEAIFEEDYGLKEFCKNVIDDLKNRCANYCYRVRLEQTAKYAKENGYDSFTTTLLISPYQNHDELIRIGKEMVEKYGIEFLYRDFRPGFRDGQAKARELGLYMQKYCGCVFSEEIRYNGHIQKDKKRAKETAIKEKNFNMNRRLTRRFIVKNMENLNVSNPIRYERYYINDNLRIQKKNDIYEKETLDDNNIVIKKEKIDITEFENLKKKTYKKIIRNSYLLLDDEKVSIKKYYGIYAGLIRVEVTFINEIEIREYQKLMWMGQEITDSPLAFDKELSKLNREQFLKELNKYI